MSKPTLAQMFAQPPARPEDFAHTALAEAEKRGIAVGCILSIAFMLRERGDETSALEWWDACGLTLEEAEASGAEDYDLDPIRRALQLGVVVS